MSSPRRLDQAGVYPSRIFPPRAGTMIGSINFLTQSAAGLDFTATSPDTSAMLCKAQTGTSATTCTARLRQRLAGAAAMLAMAVCLLPAVPAHAQYNDEGIAPSGATVLPMPYWTQPSTANSPPAGHGYSAVYDPGHQQIVLFGGTGNGVAAYTWTWDGTNWTEHMSLQSPTSRIGAQMAYDAAHGVVVLFGGGEQGGGELSDTWTWDGSNWTLQNPANSPPARNDGVMAYDAAHGNVVLFGGASFDYNNDTETLFNDTWIWDGSNWTQQNPTNSPPARVDPVFAFSRVNNAPLLCDGLVPTIANDPGDPGIPPLSSDGLLNNAYGQEFDANAALQDLWKWDGSNWEELSTSGPQLGYVRGDFDSATSQLVVEGAIVAGLDTEPQLWSWDGVRWVQEQNPDPPVNGSYGLNSLPISSTQLVYDPQTDQLIAWGGQAADGGNSNETWNLYLAPFSSGTLNVCPSASTDPSCSQTSRFYISELAADALVHYGGYQVTGNFSVGPPSCPISDFSTTCSIQVTTRPATPGIQKGALIEGHPGWNYATSYYSDGYTQYFYSIGVAPQAAVSPGVLSQVGTATGTGDNRTVAYDGAGDILTADTANNRILMQPENNLDRYESPVTIVSGLTAPIAITVDGAGNLYIVESTINTVVEVPWTNFTYGAPITIASQATLPSNLSSHFTPASVAVDAYGNVFIGDTGNRDVIEVPPTLTGFGAATVVASNLSEPIGVAVDGGENLYVLDPNLQTVTRTPWNGSSYGAPVALADTTTNGANFSPVGLSLDSYGDISYTDSNSGDVFELHASEGQITFPNTQVNNQTAYIPVTLTNIGNATMTLTYPVVSVTSSNFSLGVTDCLSTLAPGQSCSASVAFTPTVGGNLTGSLVFTNNSLNGQAPNYATQTVALSGKSTGIAIQYTVSASAAAVQIGNAVNITVSALDVLNAVQSGYRGTVHFTSTDVAAGLPANYTFTAADAGVHTFQVTLNTLGIWTVTATSTDNTITGTSGTISVNTPPVITSANQATFSARYLGNFLVTATGFPLISYTETGALPAGVSFVDNGDDTASLAGTPANGTAGTYSLTIQASDNWGSPAVQSFTLTVQGPTSYVVTQMTDDGTGNAANCPDNGVGPNCTLRDALAAAGNQTAADITFSPPSPNTPYTITLTGGTPLTLPEATVIWGPTSGGGEGLSNLITISGANASTVFVVNFSGQQSGSTINNLNITRGYNPTGLGGGIYVDDAGLTVNQCYIYQNSAKDGGGIGNTGSLILINSTLTGNSATGTSTAPDPTNVYVQADGGGGLYTAAAAVVVNSTITNNSGLEGGGIFAAQQSSLAFGLVNSTVSGNTATDTGGGLNTQLLAAFAQFTSPELALVGNSIIAGNSAGQYADLYAPFVRTNANPSYGELGGFQDYGGNLLNSGSGGSSSITASLAPLGNYGGPTPTMVPLPGSPAICDGLAGNTIDYGIQATDQRGFPRTNNTYTGYTSNACDDAGAVQTHYTSVVFAQQPTNTEVNAAITPSPVVQVLETDANATAPNNTDAVGGIPITLTFNGTGTLTPGTLSQTTDTNGNAAFSALTPNTTQSGATFSTNAITIVGSDVLPSVTSNSFQVYGGAAALNIVPPLLATVGSSFAVTVTAVDSTGDTVPNDNDTVNLTVNGAQVGSVTLVNGVGSTSLTLNAAGLTTLTGTDATTPSVTGQAGISVTPIQLTASISASSKTYNASTAATIASCTLAGVLQADSGNVACTASNASFATQNVGTGLAVTATVALSGSAAGNYTLSSAAATTANITAAPLTITAASNNKTYDTTTTAAALPTVAAGQLQGSDTVTGLAEVYSTASAGTGKTLTVSAYTVNDGNGGQNYQVTTVQNNTGVVAAATVTASVKAADKTYNGSNTATVTTCTLSGVYPADTGSVSCAVSSATFASDDAANGITVTASGVSLGGMAAGNYTLSATTATTTADITQASQMIQLTAPSSPVTYGVMPIALSATGGASGNAVLFSVISGPGTISGSTLTVTGVGTIVVAANQAGNTNYTAASQVTANIVVNQASQTIVFTPSSPITYGVSPIALTATGGASGSTVTFSVVSGPGTISGSTLTVTGAGTIVIVANQAGNANYTAATQVTASIVVNQASQAITFAPSSPVTFGVPPISLIASGGSSGNAIVFSVASGPGSITGSTLTVTGAGTIVVAANQAGNTNYTAATQVTQSIVVSAASQTITFTPPTSPVTYGVAPITLSATGGASGNAIVFSVISGPGSITGNTLTVTGSGTIMIAANQAGNTNYSAATQVIQSIVVNAASQTITFTPPTSPVTYGVAPITLSATGGASGNAVVFSVISGPGSITGNTLTVTGSGTIMIAANQTGNTNYSAATQVIQSIVVNKATPTISLVSSLNPVPAQNAITLTATVSSAVSTPTGSVSFYDGATLLGSINLNGGVAAFTTSSLATGSNSITAVYSGDANFAIVTSSTLTENVDDFNFTITSSSVTASPSGTAIFTFTVTPINSSTFPAAVTFSISGLPAGATNTFSPPTLTAGSGATTVTLTVQIPALTARQQLPRSIDRNTTREFTPFALALLLLPFAVRMRRTGRRLARIITLLVLIVSGITALVGLGGCASGNGYFGQPQQSYTVTVTGTSGALSHSAAVTLTVE